MKLSDHMLRYGIGFDPWFWERNADAPNFPPHNIEQLSPDHYRLTLAVAGFAPEEMQITIEGDLLTVKGWKGQMRLPGDPEPVENPDTRLLYRGIAFRDWTRQFKVGDHVRVSNATMEHGLLMIDLIRELPEAQKPKLIQIT